jgi:hypothetical protein
MARRRDKVWQEAGRFPHLREPPNVQLHNQMGARLRWPGERTPSGSATVQRAPLVAQCPNIGRDRIDVVA